MSARGKADIIDRLREPGIIAVVRAKSAAQAGAMAGALIAGGILAVEITLTTPDAAAAIREANRRFGAEALIGAGTVLDGESCRAVLAAGAQFVVSPILRPELVPLAHALGKPVMLGAYTPTEAQLAHEAGADFIKIFPADALGPGYVKALHGPLPHLRVVPTGGVDLANVAEFLRSGCAAVGVGSSLTTPQILHNDNWPELTRRAAAFVKAASAARIN